MTRVQLSAAALVVVAVVGQSFWLSAQNRALNKRIGNILGVQLQEGDVVDSLVGVGDDGFRRQIRFQDSPLPTLVLTFSFQCPACQQTFPVWQDLTRLALDVGIRPVWISKDPSVAARQTESRALNISTFAIFDPTYATYGQFRMTSVPTTAVVGSDGVVLKSWFGNLEITGGGSEVESYLRTFASSNNGVR